VALKVYNTLSGTKQDFKTVEPGKVKMYVCGPTVYGFLHIGNFRGPIFFNLVKNWLVESGYDVTYVYNYTDVDDKIIAKANEEGVESTVISERYIAEFEKDFANLQLNKHDHNPKVTEHIGSIIRIVEDLVAREAAYVVDGEVFYAIDSFKDYGALSKKKLDELEAGNRVEVDGRKKNPHDFVLWKPAKEGEPYWESPWGNGRPGWHIECSAMIKSILGDTIDIHGGGIDLIFPHHENEIAQGEGCCDQKYCNFWMHNNFIIMNDEKMSKSLGNIITGRAFMEEYDAEILKYLFLSAHYRSMLNVSEEKIEQTISALDRIYNALSIADKTIAEVEETGAADGGFTKLLAESDKKIKGALDDDFNTSAFIAQVFEVVRSFNALEDKPKKKKAHNKGTSVAFKEWMAKYSKVSSLFQQDPEPFLNKLDQILIKKKNVDVAKVDSLIVERNAARDAKDWSRSDEIRDELAALGVEIRDGAGATTWTMKK
jgi:cysteinyl-tRNA synthetase